MKTSGEWMRILVAAVVLSSLCALDAAAKPRVVISWGWTTPDTAYGEHWNWWLEGPDDRAPVGMRTGYRASRGLPLAYWKTQEAGRISPGSDTSVRQPISALPQKGRQLCIDGRELPKLLEKTEKVYELPVEGWTFKPDDFGVDSDDPKTFDKPIAIGKTWAEQGFAAPDTIGWHQDFVFFPHTNSSLVDWQEFGR